MRELKVKVLTTKGRMYTLESIPLGEHEDYKQLEADRVEYFTALFQKTPLYFIRLEGVSINTSQIETIYGMEYPPVKKKNFKKGGQRVSQANNSVNKVERTANNEAETVTDPEDDDRDFDEDGNEIRLETGEIGFTDFSKETFPASYKPKITFDI